VISFPQAPRDPHREERFATIFRGNQDAIRLLDYFRLVSHVWDDLIDRDKPVPPEDISGAFWTAMFEIPANPFWSRFHAILIPALRLGAFSWLASVQLERDKENPLSREIAHVCRFDVGDVAILMAELIGGTQWAAQHAAELKLLVRDEPFALYVADLEAHDR